jgi:hypothetical protein
MKAVLTRLVEEGVQSRGHLNFYEGDQKSFDCFTLELGWQNNESQVSCIPPGKYEVKKHTSPKFGKCLLILNVPGRDLILFHTGNYHEDTHGCILPGKSFIDINNDGLKDVVLSAITMLNILAIVPDKFELTII